MNVSREQAIQDQLKELSASVKDGKFSDIGEKIERIRILLLLDSLGEPVGHADELCNVPLADLQAMSEQLREQVRRRDEKERAKEKAIRDQLWFFSRIQEKYEEGRKVGRAIETIKTLDELLGRTPSDTKVLETFALEELESIIAERKAQLPASQH